MLELEIYSPKGITAFPEIKWNNEELKAEIQKAVEPFQNLLVTGDTEKDARSTRAKLNKLKSALESTRIDIKKRASDPVKRFESQVFDVEKPINDAIENIDKQLKELDDIRKDGKKDKIDEIFNEFTKNSDFPDFLTLEAIWNEKWLNKTFSLNSIIDEINSTIEKINSDMEILSALPEHSFEAIEIYKKTMDVQESMRKAKEISDMIKRKQMAENEEALGTQSSPQNVDILNDELKDEEIYEFTFKVNVTAEQAKKLGEFCRANDIQLIRVN